MARPRTRPNGGGSIFQRKRDGRWVVEVIVGWLLGDRKKVWRKALATQEEAEVTLRAMLEQREAERSTAATVERTGTIHQYRSVSRGEAESEKGIESWLCGNLKRWSVETQVVLKSGRADIVTECEVIEVKRVLDARTIGVAISQVLSYASELPGKTPVIAGVVFDIGAVQHLMIAATTLGIDVWPLRYKSGENAISVEEMARNLGISPRTMRRRLKDMATATAEREVEGA